jgi:hypothetical protein
MAKSTGAARRWAAMRPGRKPKSSSRAAQIRDAASHSDEDTVAATICVPASFASPDRRRGAVRQTQ